MTELAGGLELHELDRARLGRGPTVHDLDIGEFPDEEVLVERAAPPNAETVEKHVDGGLLVAGMVTRARTPGWGPPKRQPGRLSTNATPPSTTICGV